MDARLRWAGVHNNHKHSNILCGSFTKASALGEHKLRQGRRSVAVWRVSIKCPSSNVKESGKMIPDPHRSGSTPKFNHF